MIGRGCYTILSVSINSSPDNFGIREITTTIPDIIIMCIKLNILEFDIEKRAAKNWKRNSYCYFLPGTLHEIYFWFMVFNATINNISATMYIMAISFIRGANQSTR